jgi:hypothetical protein
VDGVGRTLNFGEQPLVVRLSDVVLNVRFRPRDQDVFQQLRQLAVVGKLAATVVGFRGFGKHFNDQGGIQQGLVKT